MKAVDQHAFQGSLTAASPMRSVFPNGLIPLTDPFSREVILEGVAQRTRSYFIAVAACTPEQREGIAQLMSRMGQGTIEAARATVATLEPIPVREQNLSGVSFPLRYII